MIQERKKYKLFMTTYNVTSNGIKCCIDLLILVVNLYNGYWGSLGLFHYFMLYDHFMATYMCRKCVKSVGDTFEIDEKKTWRQSLKKVGQMWINFRLLPRPATNLSNLLFFIVIIGMWLKFRPTKNWTSFLRFFLPIRYKDVYLNLR